MGFKLNGAPYNKDNMNIPVYRKDLKDGSAGKSNHTGIVVDKDVSKDMEDAVVAHETVHQHQQRNGELDYDNENFYWKGKTYSRKNLNEHNENLPWEKEAYKESNKILAQKNNDMKKSFKLTGYRGNGPSFKNLSEKGLIGSQDGASVDPPKKKKGMTIDNLPDHLKYRMAQSPESFNIKPGGIESKYLKNWMKDSYYKGRKREENIVHSGGMKNMISTRKHDAANFKELEEKDKKTSRIYKKYPGSDKATLLNPGTNFNVPRKKPGNVRIGGEF